MDALNPLDLYKRLCHKENKLDCEKMRNEFKLLIKERSKIRIKKRKIAKALKNP
jgi:hypothetical protein